MAECLHCSGPVQRGRYCVTKGCQLARVRASMRDLRVANPLGMQRARAWHRIRIRLVRLGVPKDEVERLWRDEFDSTWRRAERCAGCADGEIDGWVSSRQGLGKP